MRTELGRYSLLAAALILFVEKPALARISDPGEKVYSCVSKAGASVGWDPISREGKPAGLDGKLYISEPETCLKLPKAEGKPAGLDGKLYISDKEETRVTFVVLEDRGLLKGNLDQVDLIKISERSFLEMNMMGHAILWSLFPGTGKIPTLLVHHKAYPILGNAGPQTFTYIYQCD